MEKGFTVKQGTDMPLGLSYSNNCFWFAVSLPQADSCNLVLFKKGETMPAEVIPMDASAFGVFTVGVVLPKRQGYTGYEYLYETDGKTFCDPYAKKINGRDTFGEEAAYVRAEVYVPERAGISSDYKRHASEDLILYKLHVRGFTKSANSGVKKKGTYAGLTEKIPYLKELGVNGVLLLPVTEFDEREEANKHNFRSVIGAPKRSYAGQEDAKDRKTAIKTDEVPVKLNYWGYASSAYYFAPKASYAANPAKTNEEFAQMVQAFHTAGIDVYLEMMFDYNCAMTYMADCLRHWVATYGVDGFHISNGVLPVNLVAKDAYLQKTTFFVSDISDEIKEKYPGRFIEYRESFCMDMRRYLKGDEGLVPAFCHYMKNRRIGASRVHFMTDHNGFTLADLYSYDVRHNEANGERGLDGTEYNASWNCGEEGVTKKKKVLALRQKMFKNAMLTMLLSQGTPMLLAGDEFLRTKQGNNNAYCQDNEISWVDWALLKKNREFFEFTKNLITFRKEHPMFTLERTLKETDFISCGWPEVSEHGVNPWQVDPAAYNRLIALMYCGDYIRKSDRTYEDHFYLMYNMHWEEHEFELPKAKDVTWKVVFDSSEKSGMPEKGKKAVNSMLLEPRCILVLQGIRKVPKK